MRPLIWLLIATSFSAIAAAQSDPAALVRDGNALVRSGVYRTALLRYREAAAAGLDTPLLHYNLGVVHYKLGQFTDAAQEFTRAATDDALAGLALYNRGLAERAAGDTASAGASFTAAADRADQRALRRLANDAAKSLVVDAGAPAPQPSRRIAQTPRDVVARAGEFELTAAARYGTDDNVFRAPAAPYVDRSNPALPVVTPVVQSASFLPVDLHAAYVLHNEKGDTDFSFAYDLDGDFYDQGFENATQVTQRFAIGADIVLGEKERRRRTLETAFYLRDHRETNFDPDTGLDRELDGDSIADRFSYVASGVQGEFRHRLGAWQWGFDLRLERRDYERIVTVLPVPPITNYAHDYTYAATSIGYDFSDQMTFTGGLRQYRRSYDERLARDLNGDLLSTNGLEDDTYSGLQLGLVRRLTPSLEIDFDVLRLERTDGYLGYFDYTQNVGRLRAVYRPWSRFEIAVSALGRSYDYPSAFAFNDPTAGPRELDESGAQLTAQYRITRHFTIRAELETTDVTSTDTRAEYTRSRALLGAEWRR